MKKNPKKLIKKICQKFLNLRKYFDWKKIAIVPTKASIPDEFNLFTSITSLMIISFFIFSAIIHFAFPIEYWNVSLIILSFFELMFFFLVYSRKIWLSDSESANSWFKEIGYEILAIRFHVLKHQKWGGIEILIITIIFLVIFPYVFEPLMIGGDVEYVAGFRGWIFSLIWLPFIMILSNLIFRLRFYFDYFSNYYCAKGCIMMINNDETLGHEHKIRVFKFAINFYDDFLKTATGFRIKNNDAIYSSIVSELKRPLDTFYKEFLEKFEKQKTFEPLSYLASNLNETEVKNMLTTFNYSDKFKIGTKRLGPIILASLAVLNFVFGLGSAYMNELIKYLNQFMPKISFG